MTWFIVGIAILLNALASVLVKVATQDPFQLPTMQQPMVVFHNWPLLLGLACYGSAFLFYAAAVSRLPLNVVYPVLTSGAIAAVAVLSFVLFREPVRSTTVIGVAFVIMGVVLITRN